MSGRPVSGVGHVLHRERAGLDVSPPLEHDAGVNVRSAAVSHPSGYALVLLGVVGFVVSCFLPFYGGTVLGASGSISLYDSVRLPGSSTVEALAARLYLFAGTGIVGVIAFLGIVRHRTWTPHALVAAVAVWTLTWLGVLVSQWGFLQHEVGYWAALASLGVAIVGTTVVWVSSRSPERQPAQAPVS
jgi:hypothetical protein